VKKGAFMVRIISFSLVFGIIIIGCDTGGSGDKLSSSNAKSPSTPTGVNALAASTSSITISWDEVSYADEYLVYRSSSDSGTYTRVGKSWTTSYTDTKLSAGTTYYYKVSAYNIDGESPQSSYVSATTSSPNIPSAPTGVSASATTISSITISWDEVSDVKGYYVYRSSSATGTYTRVGTPSTKSYTDTKLSAGTTYYYKVSAYNSDGESLESSYISETTLPSAPTGISASATSSSSIMVSWDAVFGATGYYVYRSSSATGTYTRVGTPSTTSYTDTGLSVFTTYYYKVSAYNSTGESSQSSNTSTKTKSGPNAPSAPTGVSASATSSSITLSWTAVSNATGYYVYCDDLGDGTYTRVGTTLTTTYILNTGLSMGRNYFLKVTAYNSDGESFESSYTQATTKYGVSGRYYQFIYNQYDNYKRLYGDSYRQFDDDGSGTSGSYTAYYASGQIDKGSYSYGTYTVSSSQITITWPNGSTMTMRINNEKTIDDDGKGGFGKL